jgi:CheY-like chemotaxis protein
MPDKDGAELAIEIGEAMGEEAPPMIMLSSAGLSARERFGDAGPFAALLTKPVRRRTLHRALLEVLSGQKQSESKKPSIDGGLATRMPLRILLADDNLVNQKVGVRMLERFGYEVDVAANGCEVLDALRQKLYDVVLLDVQMPEMDGLEAARTIKIDASAFGCPYLIAVTAGATKEDEANCFAAGMDDYLSKPLGPDRLRSALEGCYHGIRGRTHLRAS